MFLVALVFAHEAILIASHCTEYRVALTIDGVGDGVQHTVERAPIARNPCPKSLDRDRCQPIIELL